MTPPESSWERELQERLREIFGAEAAERLEALDAALLALEGANGPDAAGPLTEAFRQAHTLKGGARAAGLPEVARLAHALEGVFDGLRRAGGPAGPGAWGPVYAAVDTLRDLLGGRAVDVDGAVAALDDVAAGLATGAPPAPGTERPAPAPPPPAAPDGPAPVAGDAVRVPRARLERLMADVRELHAGLAGLRLRAAEARRLDRNTARLGRTLRRYRLRRTAGPARPSAAAGPPAGGIDGLDLIDEMGALRRRLDADVHRLEHAASELGDSVRRLAMVPVGVALAGLPRLVRDTAAACGKEARLELAGEDTEVDRSVLEGIAGAVTHLVRNAVDHGLERPEQRRAAGKPAAGRVRVAAREERGRLLLEVGDDGGGIDIEAVRHRAGELGLANGGPPDHDAGLEWLFRPGFSTAAGVTEVSGRGVGLDAVRAAAQALGGSVSVHTEPGKGTTFTVSLPLTLATTRALLVRAGGRTLALPLAAVGRVERVSPPSGPTGAATATAAVHLGPLLGLGEPAAGTARAVLSTGDAPTAVFVDEIRGEEELVVSHLPPPLRHVRFTAGAAVLGTGEVVPILHPAEVFGAAAAPAGRVVVVADDSAAGRTAAQVALESAGYTVRPATDGAEALALIEEGGCDALLSDVQMPGLDGVALCRRLRRDPRFADLPVVLLTSLGSPAERREGLAAGADAYLVKDRAGLATVLATLRSLL
ncbi:MAG TPA: response regulator [Acidimicrobiia bacterium]|nr:response regulator [Acidimicrobiia bacterium]